MRLCKNKFLNILLNILILVAIPVLYFFFLVYCFEFAIAFVLLVPGFFAFLLGGLKNGGKV